MERIFILISRSVHLRHSFIHSFIHYTVSLLKVDTNLLWKKNKYRKVQLSLTTCAMLPLALRGLSTCREQPG